MAGAGEIVAGASQVHDAAAASTGEPPLGLVDPATLSGSIPLGVKPVWDAMGGASYQQLGVWEAAISRGSSGQVVPALAPPMTSIPETGSEDCRFFGYSMQNTPAEIVDVVLQDIARHRLSVPRTACAPYLDQCTSVVWNWLFEGITPDGLLEEMVCAVDAEQEDALRRLKTGGCVGVALAGAVSHVLAVCVDDVQRQVWSAARQTAQGVRINPMDDSVLGSDNRLTGGFEDHCEEVMSWMSRQASLVAEAARLMGGSAGRSVLRGERSSLIRVSNLQRIPWPRRGEVTVAPLGGEGVAWSTWAAGPLLIAAEYHKHACASPHTAMTREVGMGPVKQTGGCASRSSGTPGMSTAVRHNRIAGGAAPDVSGAPVRPEESAPVGCCPSAAPVILKDTPADHAEGGGSVSGSWGGRLPAVYSVSPCSALVEALEASQLGVLPSEGSTADGIGFEGECGVRGWWHGLLNAFGSGEFVCTDAYHKGTAGAVSPGVDEGVASSAAAFDPVDVRTALPRVPVSVRVHVGGASMHRLHTPGVKLAGLDGFEEHPGDACEEGAVNAPGVPLAEGPWLIESPGDSGRLSALRRSVCAGASCIPDRRVVADKLVSLVSEVGNDAEYFAIGGLVDPDEFEAYCCALCHTQLVGIHFACLGCDILGCGHTRVCISCGVRTQLEVHQGTSHRGGQNRTETSTGNAHVVYTGSGVSLGSQFHALQPTSAATPAGVHVPTQPRPLCRMCGADAAFGCICHRIFHRRWRWWGRDEDMVRTKRLIVLAMRCPPAALLGMDYRSAGGRVVRESGWWQPDTAPCDAKWEGFLASLPFAGDQALAKVPLFLPTLTEGDIQFGLWASTLHGLRVSCRVDAPVLAGRGMPSPLGGAGAGAAVRDPVAIPVSSVAHGSWQHMLSAQTTIAIERSRRMAYLERHIPSGFALEGQPMWQAYQGLNLIGQGFGSERPAVPLIEGTI